MNKKKVLIVLIVSLLVVCMGIGTILVIQNQNIKQEVEVQKELEYKYYTQSKVFGLGLGSPDGARYMPYNDRFINQIYRELAYYKKDTGKELTIPEIQEYLSQEFEDDGSLRIYDNGMHPKIEEYIEWWMEPRQNEKIEEYVDKLKQIYYKYRRENYTDKGLESPFPAITDFTFGQYDELIKKEADPSYEMQFDFE